MHGAQLLQDSRESTQGFDVQLLPKQEQFPVVLHSSKRRGDVNKSQGSNLPLYEVKPLYGMFLW